MPALRPVGLFVLLDDVVPGGRRGVCVHPETVHPERVAQRVPEQRPADDEMGSSSEIRTVRKAMAAAYAASAM